MDASKSKVTNSEEASELVPTIAAELGSRSTGGDWIDRNVDPATSAK